MNAIFQFWKDKCPLGILYTKLQKPAVVQQENYHEQLMAQDEIFTILTAITASDGSMDDSEMLMLGEIASRLGYDKTSMEDIFEDICDIREDSEAVRLTIHQSINKLKQVNNPSLNFITALAATAIAYADGKLDDSEKEILDLLTADIPFELASEVKDAIFTILSATTAADGSIDASETAMLKEMADFLNYPTSSLTAIETKILEIEKDKLSIDNEIEKALVVLKAEKRNLVLVMTVVAATAIAYADGRLDDAEMAILAKI